MKETIVILQYIDNNKTLKKDGKKIVFHGDIKIDSKEFTKVTGIKSNDGTIFIPEFIFLDDTMRTVKQKIFNYLNNKSEFKKDKFIIEEILLTGEKEILIDADDIYDKLENIENANEYLYGLINNLRNESKKTVMKKIIKDKKNFDYTVIRNIFEGKTVSTLCEKTVSTLYSDKINLFVTANPFHLDDAIIGKVNEKEFFNINNDNNLFVDQDIINDNVNGVPVYSLNLMFASDIIKYFQDKSMDVNYLFTMYFPLLKLNEVHDADLFREKETVLYSKNIEEISKIFEKEDSIQNLFYELYNEGSKKYKYIKEGFSYIKLNITQGNVFKVNLENIFKLLSTTEDYPLFRINYGRGKDKLYRLYSKDKTSKKTGSKGIPFVDKAVINRIKKLPGRTNTITLYTEFNDGSSIFPLIIDILENCDIHVTVENEKKFVTQEKMQEIISQKVTPIVKKISNYLSNNGYTLQNFSGIEDSEIISTNYNLQLDIVDRISLKSIKKCLSTMFYIIKDDIKKEIVLIYKKVTNFNNKDEEVLEYYIAELLVKGLNDSDILSFIKENFNIEKPEDKLKTFKSNMQTYGEGFEKSRKKYSGIFITLKRQPGTSLIDVIIKDNDILNYIPMIKDNIIGLIELVLNIDSYDINKRCNIKMDLKMKEQIDDNAAFNYQQEEEVDVDSDDFADWGDDSDNDSDDSNQEGGADDDTPSELEFDLDDFEDWEDESDNDDDKESVQAEKPTEEKPVNFEVESDDEDSFEIQEEQQPEYVKPESDEEDSPLKLEPVSPETAKEFKESIQKFKDEEFKGRSASPVPSLGDFPDIDEEDPDEDITGEELLAQIPKSPRNKNDEEPGQAESSDWKQIKIVDESDSESASKSKSKTPSDDKPKIIFPDETQVDDEDDDEDEETDTDIIEEKEDEIYFNSKSGGEFKYLSNFYGDVEICYMQKRYKHPKMKALFDDFRTCSTEKFKEYLKLLQSSKKVTKHWFDGEEPIRGILAKLVGGIITKPDSPAFKKRAKNLAEYLGITVEEVMQSDKRTTDQDMIDCLMQKYKIPKFRDLLLKTGDKKLHERPTRGQSNDWTYPGKDKLGRLLVKIRAQKIEEEKRKKIKEDSKEKSKDKDEKKAVSKSKKSNLVINPEDLDGRRLDFLSKNLTNRDPDLFITESTDKYKSYSRSCPSNVKRQPIILTDAEKERIDRENPGSYDGAINYGSKKDNKHWFICPRYWCLLTNLPMTEKQVKDGECGGKIIPHNAKEVPKGKYIYEFYAKTEHEKDGKYIQHYPGYLAAKTHRNGLCAPCCFKTNMDKGMNKERKDQCELDQKVRDGLAVKEKTKPVVQVEKVSGRSIILGSDKFPIENGRYGFLPIEIEMFLDIDHSSYFIKGTNKIKPAKKHFLRMGVENSDTQSFISAISKVYSYIFKENLETIVEFKNRIINFLTLDNFLTFQNGNLYTLFLEKDADLSLITGQKIDKYKGTQMYKSFNNDNNDGDNIKYLKQLISSFENFISYLKTENNVIDYTYLWDIITNRNGIFRNASISRTEKDEKTQDAPMYGINLVILDILKNDNTANVSFICPTNAYASNKFIKKRKTIILIKNENYYEPMGLYNIDQADKEKFSLALSIFDSDGSSTLAGTKKILTLVNKIMTKCVTYENNPKHHKMEKNITLRELAKIFQSKKFIKQFKIKRFIVNYHNKVIGILIEDIKRGTKDNTFYIPCYSSPIPSEYSDIKIATTDDILGELENYRTTLKLLDQYQKIIGNGLKTAPYARVIDDGKIVGILTIADQFVPIQDPEDETGINYEEPTERAIHTIYSSNYLHVDKTIAINKNQDTYRIQNVKNIKMESLYYNLFRGTFKKMLHKYENYDIRDSLLNIVEDKSKDNNEKRIEVSIIVKNLLKDVVSFVKHDKKSLNSIYDMQKCFDKDPQSEECNVSLCAKGNTKCLLLFPKTNLMNPSKNNESLYYNRLIDEIIRYDRIKKYIFDKKVYLSLEKIQYNLGKNEMLIYESELDQATLNTLKTAEKTRQLKKNIFDMVNPEIKTTQIKTIYEADEFDI